MKKLFKFVGTVAAISAVVAGGVAPVSYTHLDVYKRQGAGTVGAVSEKTGS